MSELNTPQERLKYFILIEYKKQKDFALALGVTPQDLNKYLRNSGSIYTSADKQKRLEELGLNLNWYLTGDGVMKSRKPGEKVGLNEAEFADNVVIYELPDLKNMTFAQILDYKKKINNQIIALNNLMSEIDNEILKATNMYNKNIE